ncbi:IS3 family transposase [Metabacillus rhizolycopersici]|uniref:IS3 family transposase n=1 Tax=Metabacillus rhizolycopersici TaxID=2875709 RepID=A0ABS7UR41_9BACI|nr:IS3 family transposase [Metabacillus rhizolycopersici]
MFCEKYQTCGQAKNSIFEYIVMLFNYNRIHSSNN